MTALTETETAVLDWLASQRAFIDVLHVDVFDPDALAVALGSLPPSYNGVATIALVGCLLGSFTPGVPSPARKILSFMGY